MALENLVSVEFDAAEISHINEALDTIIGIIKPKAINLNVDERKQYGKVRYENVIWIDKSSGYISTNPEFVPNYLNTAEYNKDYAAFNVVKPIQQKLQQAFEMFDDTFILLGHDLFFNSLSYYYSVKSAAQSNAPGSTAIYNDLKQQFPGGRKKKETPPTPPTP